LESGEVALMGLSVVFSGAMLATDAKMIGFGKTYVSTSSIDELFQERDLQKRIVTCDVEMFDDTHVLSWSLNI
jgi:hypothetical protein